MLHKANDHVANRITDIHYATNRIFDMPLQRVGGGMLMVRNGASL
jgi:hypothetical protein